MAKNNSVKINLEITSLGYTQRIEYRGKKYTKVMKRTHFGCEGAGTKGLPEFIEENLGNPEEIM